MSWTKLTVSAPIADIAGLVLQKLGEEHGWPRLVAGVFMFAMLLAMISISRRRVIWRESATITWIVHVTDLAFRLGWARPHRFFAGAGYHAQKACTRRAKVSDSAVFAPAMSLGHGGRRSAGTGLPAAELADTRSLLPGKRRRRQPRRCARIWRLSNRLNQPSVGSEPKIQDN